MDNTRCHWGNHPGKAEGGTESTETLVEAKEEFTAEIVAGS